MEEQNRVNEEKDKRPETRIRSCNREKKVGEGVIRKMRTQGEIASNLTPVEEKDAQKKRDKEK